MDNVYKNYQITKYSLDRHKYLDGLIKCDVGKIKFSQYHPKFIQAHNNIKIYTVCPQMEIQQEENRCY